MDVINYRRDIDGLRALSVIAVILYHYQIGPISGGFIGVDIFFVISGYLITSIILKEINNDQFSFSEFYARRIRRILPAALFITICTLIAAYFILLPSTYIKLGDSATYAVLGISNFYFLWNTGYFDTRADFHPLLHTWSLSVEEQFYLIWPLLIIIATRIATKWRHFLPFLIGLVFIISLIISQYTVTHEPKSAFYMLHSRAWELALGGAITLLPTIKQKTIGTVVSTIGLLFIAWPIFNLDSDSAFPGTTALIPCLGAAFIILPKRNNLVSTLLSTPLLVFVGKISFSLYLWHWPLLVMYRHYGTGHMPGNYDKALLLFASLLLSVLTWRYLEQTFRNMKQAPKRYTILSGGSAAILTTLFGAYISIKSGFPERLPEPLRRVERLVRETVTSQNGHSNCFITSKSKNGLQDFSNQQCISANPDKRNVLIVGDSHAAHFSKALRTLYPDVHFSQVTGSGCIPKLHAKGASICSSLMHRAIDEAIPSGRFDTVIFSALWKNNYASPLREVILWTQKYVDDIVVLGPTIEYKKPLPTLLAKSAIRNDDGEIIKRSRRYAYSKKRARYLRSEIKDLKINYFSVIDSVCPKGKCLLTDQHGTPLQFDYGHFTYQGALVVIDKLKKQGLLAQNRGQSSS
jgi:peptidoglycan/LPS O-acetylase OafA/YrhL